MLARTSVIVFLLLLVTSSTAVAQSLTITSPESGEEVRTPFLVQGTTEPGAVLVLEVDEEFVQLFRADSEGQFSTPVDVPAEFVTVHHSTDDSISSTVAVRVAGTRQAPPIETSRTPTEVRPSETDDSILITEEPPPLSELGEPEPVEPVSVEESDESDEEDSKRWHAGVMATQVPAGVAGGLAGALGGFYFGAVVLSPALYGGQNDFIGVEAFIPAGLGFIAGTWLSVHAVGALWGAKSPWWTSLVGTLAGGLASAAFPPAALVVPATTATIAFHLGAR